MRGRVRVSLPYEPLGLRPLAAIPGSRPRGLLSARTYTRLCVSDMGDEFTAADIMMGYALQSFERNVGEAPPPNAAAYFERLKARPAFAAAEVANCMENGVR